MLNDRLNEVRGSEVAVQIRFVIAIEMTHKNIKIHHASIFTCHANSYYDSERYNEEHSSAMT